MDKEVVVQIYSGILAIKTNGTESVVVRWMDLESVIHQHESAIGIRMSPPSRTSLTPSTPSHPSRLSESTGLSSMCHTANFPLAIYFTYGNVYVSICPPSSSPTVSYFFFMAE